jgi:hypothetical protein
MALEQFTELHEIAGHKGPGFMPWDQVYEPVPHNIMPRPKIYDNLNSNVDREEFVFRDDKIHSPNSALSPISSLKPLEF